MNDEQKKYCDMQREYYEAQSEDMQRFNHGGHELNPDYACTLLQDCHVEPKWKNTKVFEFGCGCGRNILWLRKRARWCTEISGCDLSANNIDNTRSNIDAETSVPGSPAPTSAPPCTNLYVSSGMDCGTAPSNHYDLVFSTIVLQHICVHSIRYSIMTDVHRILVPNGIFSFQMGFDGDPREPISLTENGTFRSAPLPSKVDNQADYHENNTAATQTNSDADVRIVDPQEVIADLEKIGFKDVTYKITYAWQDNAHEYWIWFQARKV